MRGQPKTMPFTVAVQPEGDAAVALDGSFLQEALLPKWLLPALLALAALALIWFFLLKPAVQTTARDAVAQPVAQANQHAAQAQKSADAASKDASAAAAAAGKPPPTTATPTTTQKKATSGGASSAANALGSPVEGRLAVQCPPTCSSSVKAASKQTLSVTDLILQNPEGDSGTLTIAVNGKTALVSRLDNFRDLDYHFIAPLTLSPGDSMTITVQCQNKGKKACTDAVFYSGFGKRSKK